MDPSTIVAAIVTVFCSAGFSGLIAALISRKKIKAESDKTDADAAKVITDIALQMVEPLRKQIEAQNKRIDVQDRRIEAQDTVIFNQTKELLTLRPLPRLVEEMTRGINILISQIRAQGHEPDWTIDMVDVNRTQSGAKRRTTRSE